MPAIREDDEESRADSRRSGTGSGSGSCSCSDCNPPSIVFHDDSDVDVGEEQNVDQQEYQQHQVENQWEQREYAAEKERDMEEDCEGEGEGDERENLDELSVMRSISMDSDLSDF
eukprot:gene32870-40580_t